MVDDPLFKTLAEYSDESMSRYLEQRLRYTRQLDLPPSVQFDLARSAMSQDQLREISATFGRQDVGYGITDMITHLTSRQPDKVPVADLKRYQQGLIDRGYAPPNATATGVWGPEWSGASYMFEDSNRRDQMGGDHWASTAVVSGLEVMTNTLPSKLWQSIVGGAKGLIEQTPETVMRLGAVGGAAAGAAIGTAIVPGAGTVIGAGIGAIGGFLGDLLTNDDEEQEGLFTAANFVDALTPWTEYTGVGGLKNLWEDVGWTLTAASLAKGAGMAIKGVGGIGAEMAGARTAAAAQGMTPTTANALRAIGQQNPTILGFMGKYVKPLGAVLRSEPLALARGVTTLTRPLVTGVTVAGTGARYFGGVGQGTAGKTRDALQQAEVAKGSPLTAEEIAKIKSDVASQEGSTIESSIASTEELGGPTVPLLGKVVDLPSLFLVPEQVFPWKLNQLGKAITEGIHLGEQTLAPGAEALQMLARQKGEYIKLGDATSRWRGLLGKTEEEAKINAYWLEMQAGFDTIAHQMAARERATMKAAETAPAVDGLVMKYKANLYEKVRSGELPADDVRAVVTGENRHAMTRWLIYNSDSLERFEKFVEASRLSSRVTQDIRTGSIELLQEPRGLLSNSQEWFNRSAVNSEIAGLRAEAADLRSQAARLSEPEEIARLEGIAAGKENSAEELLKVRPSTRAAVRTTENMSITAALPDTWTSSEFLENATQYKLLRKELLDLEKAAKGIDDAAHPARLQAAMARQRLNEFTQLRIEEGKLPAEMLDNVAKDRPGLKPLEYWREKSKYAAADARPYLDADTAKLFDNLGYKPVITGSDLFQLDDVHQVADALNLPEYKWYAKLIDTMGLSPLVHTDRSIVEMMNQNQKLGIRSVLEQAGIKADPDAVFRDLIRETRKDRDNVHIGKILVGKAAVPDVRSLTPDRVATALANYGEIDSKVAGDIWKRLKQPYGAEAKIFKPKQTLQMIGQAIRVNGLPGYADVIRSWHMPDPGRWQKSLYTALGAGLGAGSQIFDPDHEYAKGALLGGALGFGVGALGFAKHGYGYLPERLMNIHNMLRFTLSPTFDAGRFMEQNGIAMAKHGLQPMLSPEKWLRSHPGWTPFHDNASADEMVQDAWALWDRISGGQIKVADDLERRISAAGVLGFVPQKFEAAQALQLAQKWHAQGKSWTDEKLLNAVLEIGRYGAGRSGLEKSVNFMFFPFSYVKKLTTVAGDFILQEPARRLILHQLMSNYYLSGTDDRIHDFIREKAPILNNISRITNFGAYGLSPGRFFLAGLKDHNMLGSVTQALSSMFVPSGAAQPLAETFGNVGDGILRQFMPVTLTKDELSSSSVLDDFEGYLPVIRDLSAFFNDGMDQITTFNEGLSPEAQMDEYLNEKRTFTNDMDPVAMAMGYADFEGLRGSTYGAGFQALYESKMNALADKYPTGFRMASSFDSQWDAVDAKALYDLVNDEDRTVSEDRLVKIYRIQQYKEIYSQMGMPSAQVNQMVSAMARREALKYLDDSKFVGYWDRFFAKEFGPLTVTR